MLALDPDNYFAIINKIVTLNRIEEFHEIIRLCNKYMYRDGFRGDIKLEFWKGISLYNLGNGIGALTCLGSVKLKDPKFYEVNFTVLLKKEIPQSTMESYNGMIKINPKNKKFIADREYALLLGEKNNQHDNYPNMIEEYFLESKLLEIGNIKK